jgi:hypothetical protein
MALVHDHEPRFLDGSADRAQQIPSPICALPGAGD